MKVLLYAMNTFPVGPEVAPRCGHIRALWTIVSKSFVDRLHMNFEMLPTRELPLTARTRVPDPFVTGANMPLEGGHCRASERADMAREAQTFVLRLPVMLHLGPRAGVVRTAVAAEPHSLVNCPDVARQVDGRGGAERTAGALIADFPVQ
jgi:hypothetical protein